MKKKNQLLMLFGTILMFLTFITSNIVFAADDTTLPSRTLNVKPNNEGNFISLNWTKPDESKNYSYMIYSKKSTDSIFQSIPAKNNVKVLNIYPGIGNNLKTWIETNGYGKGLISVDEVDISAFNSNPSNYLKDSNGSWKYDVVFIGAWNANANQDITQYGADLIKEFIQSGRGFLGGHDTMWSNSTAQNTRQLRSFANIKIGSYYEGNYYYPTGTVDFPSQTTYPSPVSGTQVQINKKGLLTSYPWDIGNPGTILDVPMSHTTSEFAYGDVWMKYAGKTETLSPDGLNGTNNFYLTTWNNTAQIQTGHSNGIATPDEQKLLANTLFYLSQVTEATSWDDHKGQDVDAPTIPAIPKVSTDTSKNKTNITFDSSTDNGTTYDYYVEATELTSGTKTKSNIKTGTITTGLKGYSIIVDKNSDTTPPSIVNTTSNTFSIDQSYSDDFYVHIAAIDNAGNMSEVRHYKYSNPTLSLTPNTTSVTSDPVTINAVATSSTSEIEKIQTPDGNWVNSSTTNYVVNDNGTYSFTAVDKEGHQTTQSITISNIVPKIVLNIEPEKDKIHLNENVSALLTIDNIKEIAAEDVRIKYDSTKLQFLGCTELDGIKLLKNDTQTGELRFILVSKGLSNVVNSKKSLLKLNFKGIAPGDALVDVTKGRVSDGIAMEKNLKDAECGQAIINVSDKELIDVNNDGDFSLLDLAIDGRHYGEDPSTLPNYNTDIAINGAIDDNDFTEIVKLMLQNPKYNF